MTRRTDDADVQVALAAAFMVGFALVVAAAVVALARRVRVLT